MIAILIFFLNKNVDLCQTFAPSKRKKIIMKNYTKSVYFKSTNDLIIFRVYPLLQLILCFVYWGFILCSDSIFSLAVTYSQDL